MRNIRDYILETIKPLAPGERKFWDKHAVAVKKHDEPERDEARARATNVKEAPFKGKGEDGWLKTGTDATQRDERDDVKRLGEDDLDEGRWFRTSYGWAGGAKPGGGKYKHPETVAQERREKRKRRNAFDPRKPKETTQSEEYELDEGPRGWGGRPRRQKTGIIPHSLDGKSVQVKVGEHAGKTGIVKYTTREHTFSQLVPYATRHSVAIDGGHQAEFHKNHLKRMTEDDDLDEGDRAGQDVTIHGGMSEFHGKTGTITGKEGKAYRVKLHTPVHVPGVGHVRDDLWEPQHLKTIRQKRTKR